MASTSKIRWPVVFLHGFLGDEDSFQGVIDALGEAIVPFTPVLYGHHKSTQFTAESLHSFELEVKRLGQLIREQFPVTPVHLVGYSMGGRLALALLCAFPSYFSGATLISARRGLETETERAARAAADGRWAELIERVPFIDFVEQWEAQPLFATQLVLPALIREEQRCRRLRHHPPAIAAAMRVLSLAKMPSLRTEVRDIRCPVTVLAGELDKKFVDLGRELAGSMPHARAIVVPGAGHNLPLERPRDVAAAITESLNYDEHRVEESQGLSGHRL